MNVKEYIQSGLVESYVLGLATEAERTEFEQACATYPELVAYRDAFERSLEQQLLADAVPPPAFLKVRVLEAVQPATTEVDKQEDVQRAPVRKMNAWAWLAAACFIGLLAVGYWAISLNKKYNDAQAAELAAVQKQKEAEQALQQQTTELAAVRQQVAQVQQPGIRVAAMKGTAVAPQATTTVFWDSRTKDVYLLVNNLPQVPSDKQYQLWALLDGKPIDLGMLPATETRLMVKMKNVQNAQAFAITLEPKGGSVSPTLEAMYVSGNL